MPNPAEIAAKLTRAQRRAEFYGAGHRRLPKVVIELRDLGLVITLPSRDGFFWKPTDTGKAVRAHLEKNDDRS